MKNKLYLILIILLCCRILHALPVAGVSGISGNTERANTLSLLIEQHIIEILKKNNFSTIDAVIINRELVKFNCVEEKCILKFAENADIDLIIKGTVTDKKNLLIIKLQAYGINIPFNNRIITEYEIELPLDVRITSREFSLISEEHSAEFLSRVLNDFVFPVKIRSVDNKLTVSENIKISGKFKFYSADKDKSLKENGELQIDGEKITIVSGTLMVDHNFILLPFKVNSREISRYYTARKREIVFGKSSLYDTLFLFAVTPFASASMPLSSPFLGYYVNNDWSGLGLWMVNAPPYMYLEAKGFLNSPYRLKNKKEDISRDDMAAYYFAWYMLAAGGMPLFIDSYTNDYLHQLSYFTGNNQLLGNTSTAAMLSTVSNGAGLFYRGERFWGYFYFHLNNVLLYMTLREYSVPEYYDETSGRYIKGKSNKNKAITYGSLFALSKTVEIIHSITGRENIASGKITDEYAIPGPLFTLDDRGNPVYGINVTLRF